MKIMIAGDTHGNTYHVMNLIDIAQDENISTILQCGDFGYWPHGKHSFLTEISHYLGQADIKIYFVPGNHEHWDELDKLPQDKISEPFSNIFYIPPGTPWIWDGVKFLGLGGAFSIDKYYRTPYVDWFPQECITNAQALHAMEAGKVDVLISHDAPYGTYVLGHHEGDDDRYPESLANRKNLREVVEACQPKMVLHGHHHQKYTQNIQLKSGPTVMVQGLSKDVGPMSFRKIEDSYTIFDTEKFKHDN